MLSTSSANGEVSVSPLNPPPGLPVVKHKLVLLGDQSVGKTSIIARFIYDSFDARYQTTIGVDFFSKLIPLPTHTVRLHIWDTAGQERFRALIPGYIRHSAAAVVVYDITSRPSFLVGLAWVDDVRAERGDDVVVVLVGNKVDLADAAAREVGEAEAAKEAAAHGARFLEVSAKHGTNVRGLFRSVAEALPGPTPAELAAGGGGEGLAEAAARTTGGGGGGVGTPLGMPANAFLVTPSAMRAAGERMASGGGDASGAPPGARGGGCC